MNKFFLILLVAVQLASISSRAREGDEENPAVGAEKGITEANEKDGFKLSPEAVKNFEIRTVPFSGQNVFRISKSGIFFGLQENNLFRVRGGFYKRIDFKTLSKTAQEWTVSSSDLKPGDQIVVSGVGHLRIVELQASGGIADEH